MGNLGWLQPAQFVGIRKFVETLQSKKFEEERGGFVEERTPGLFGTARDADDFALEQGGDHAIDGHAAYRFDFRAPDWLAVGNDGECFQRRLAEPRRLRLLEKLVGPDGKFGSRLEQITARNSLHHQAGAFSSQLIIQLLDGGFHLGDGGLFVGRGFRRGRKLHRLVQGMGDGFGRQGPIRRVEQRFDDAGQVHPTIFWKTAPKGKR